MDGTKRGRGRPKGSGVDDSEALMAIARLVTDDPRLKPTTAMKRVLRTRRNWGASDDSLVRRWQEKWKAGGASYLQRVQNERAEAERHRQEPVAQARQADPRSTWDIIAGTRAAGHLPGWALQSAMQKYVAESAITTRTAGQWLAVAGAMDKTTISRADLVARSSIMGATMSEAMRSILSVATTSGIGDAMRKYGTIGRALEGVSAVHMPRLPKGF